MLLTVAKASKRGKATLLEEETEARGKSRQAMDWTGTIYYEGARQATKAIQSYNRPVVALCLW